MAGSGRGPSRATKVPQRMRCLSRSHRRKSWSLVCQRTKKVDGNLWTTQRKRLLVNSLYLKIPLQAPNEPCRTLLLGEMGETLENKSMTSLWEQLVLLVQKYGTIKEQIATLVWTCAKHSNLKCGTGVLSFWSDETASSAFLPFVVYLYCFFSGRYSHSSHLI